MLISMVYINVSHHLSPSQLTPLHHYYDLITVFLFGGVVRKLLVLDLGGDWF